MSAVNLDEIKKKYGFKNVSVATWRDPSGSILPARGGPRSPSISAAAAAKPYTPTYKVSYRKPPEPTDDEESEEDDEVETQEDVAKEEQPETVPEAEDLVDSPMQPAAYEPSPAPTLPSEESFPSSDTAPSAGMEEECRIEGDVVQVTEGPELDGEKLPAPIARGDSPMEDGDGIVDIIEAPNPVEPKMPVDVQEATEAEQSPGDDVPPSAPSPPPLEPSEAASTEDKHHAIAADISGSSPDDVAALDDVEVDSAEPAVVDVPPPPSEQDDHIDKKVTFAPGTPEPRPTPRKKKSTTGTKSKSKKRTAAPVEYLPDDIVAIVDGDGVVESVPLPEAPVLADVDTPANEIIEEVAPPIGEAESPSPVEEAEAGGDEPTEVLPEPAIVEEGAESVPEEEAPIAEKQETGADVSTAEPATASNDGPAGDDAVLADISDIPPADDIPAEKSSKKKSTKGKKNPSKTKSKDSSLLADGLGIEIAPPSILDIDDIFDGIPPPPPPPPGMDFFELIPPPPALLTEPPPEEIAVAGTTDLDGAEPHSTIDVDQVPVTDETIPSETLEEPADNDQQSVCEQVRDESAVDSEVDLNEEFATPEGGESDLECEPGDGEPEGELENVPEGEVDGSPEAQAPAAENEDRRESTEGVANDSCQVPAASEDTGDEPSHSQPGIETSGAPDEDTTPPEPEASAEIPEESKDPVKTAEESEGDNPHTEPQASGDAIVGTTDEVIAKGEDDPLSTGLQEESVNAPEAEEAIVHNSDGEGALGEGDLSEVAPGEVAPGEVAPGEVAPGEVAPGKVALGEVAPGEVIIAQGKEAISQGVAGEGAPYDEAVPDDGTLAKEDTAADNTQGGNNAIEDHSEPKQNLDVAEVLPDQSESDNVLTDDITAEGDVAGDVEASEEVGAVVEAEQVTVTATAEESLSAEKDESGLTAIEEEALEVPRQQRHRLPSGTSYDRVEGVADEQPAGADAEHAIVVKPTAEQLLPEEVVLAPVDTSEPAEAPTAGESLVTEQASKPVPQAPPSPTLSKSSSPPPANEVADTVEMSHGFESGRRNLADCHRPQKRKLNVDGEKKLERQKMLLASCKKIGERRRKISE
ncbi:hypothetical protein LTR65_009516 [Meristemomyces frigidus]